MEAVAKINTQLREIRKELNQSVFGADKPEPKAFNPLTDKLPAEIDALFDKAIAAAKADDEDGTIDACRKIEAYFGFPAPNELVQKAEIPGGMYSNMVAQLKQLKAEDILPRAMELIPSVRLAAGLPPLVTPTSQIVGAQARQLRPRREGRASDVHQQELAVRRPGQGRVRTHARENRPRIPL